MATAKKAAAKKRSAQATASNAVDQQLARYRSMRNFGITTEPSGGASSEQEQLPFCIQKHAASHLHYDFRLGWNGVLKSWAVAKGPSYVVADKRLAVQVEDHPIEYGGFEGIIPAGQYGGGPVMLWDQGTWQPQEGHTDIDAGLRDGSLKFILNGTKMHGKWALIRMGGKAATERKPNWLLIKEHDGFERPPSAPPITEEEPNSVVTKRSIEQIAAQEDHVWNSKDTAKGKAWYRQDAQSKPAHTANRTEKLAAPPRRPRSRFSPDLRALPTESQPTFIKPHLALEAAAPPTGSGWLHELKLDGYRIQARKDGGNVRLFTRSGLDWTHRMPAIAAAVRQLPADQATLDGEVVVLAADGTTSFADLQASFQDGAKHPLTCFCFDLLHLDGHSTRDLPLIDRKSLLAGLLAGPEPDTLRLSEHLEASGDQVFGHACALHIEGIVSKRAQSKYLSSRNGDWLKLKCVLEQEFVVGGFTLPSNGIHGVGALLLGYYEGGKLIYAGRTGTGFTQKTHRALRDQLNSLAASQSPFANIPTAARKGANWVKPTLVAQVRFATWTADKQLRQAAFLGLREDKPAKEVVREEAAPTAKRSRTQAAKAAAHRLAPKAVAAKVSPPKEDDHAPVRLTHPDKILDAESGMTKQVLADFYWAIAPHILPHIAGRPISLVRCPEGSGSPCFYQKHVTAMLPKDISAVMVPDKKSGKPEPYITLDTREALAGLAQMGVLEIHPWGAKNDDLEHPDRIVIDLDPDPSLPWSTLAGAADEVRARLRKLGLESFLKTTGGKGLHVVAPIDPTHDWDTVKTFTRNLALAMEKQSPSLYLSKMTKSARTGKIYVDYLRNERGATAVAPYSPRARAGAAVSMPLFWKELSSAERPEFRVSGYADWKQRLGNDPWKSILRTRQQLTPEAIDSARNGR
jgi:bifunctional non-homologous end joining protein LigD